MRYILIFWAAPLSLFWGWYYLSYHDMNFGYLFLSRDIHDLAFALYGQMLGIDPAVIPGLVAKACVVDTLLIMAIFAFRRRAELRAWMRGLRARYLREGSAPSA